MHLLIASSHWVLNLRKAGGSVFRCMMLPMGLAGSGPIESLPVPSYRLMEGTNFEAPQ